MFVFVQDDLRLGDGQLIPFPAHIFDQHGNMQLAASADLEAVGGIGRFDLQADVDFQFLFKPFLQVAGSDIFAALSCKRRSC